jgi:hypothetical protein
MELQETGAGHAVVRLLKLGGAGENDQGFIVAEFEMKAARRAKNALFRSPVADAGLGVIEDDEGMIGGDVEESEGDVLQLQIVDGLLDGLGLAVLGRLEHVEHESNLVGAPPVVLLSDGGDRPLEGLVESGGIAVEGDDGRAVAEQVAPVAGKHRGDADKAPPSADATSKDGMGTEPDDQFVCNRLLRGEQPGRAAELGVGGQAHMVHRESELAVRLRHGFEPHALHGDAELHDLVVKYGLVASSPRLKASSTCTKAMSHMNPSSLARARASRLATA